MSPRRRLAPLLTAGLLVGGLVACGDDSEQTEDTSGTVPHVGELPALQTGRTPAGAVSPPATTDVGTATSTPATASTDETIVDATTVDTSTPAATDVTTGSDETDSSAPDETDVADGTAPATSAVATLPPVPDAVLGRAAGGNRVLALGDSITAAIGPEYGGQLCDALVDEGWFLGVDAVQGRAIDAARDDVESDIDTDDWDAVIVNLGSNYRGDAEAYARDLRGILRDFDDRPILLVTVTEFEENIAEVNYVLRDVANDEDDQVWVLEWSERTRDDGSLTGADGLHLSEEGRAELSDLLADAVGAAPAGDATEPDCDLLRSATSGAGSSDDGADDSGGDGGG